MTRFFDIVISLFGIIILAPLGLLLSFAIVLESKGPPFYVQKRVGRYAKLFSLYKFRTMYTGSDKKGLLTVGAKDGRITKVGFFLRKYKLDELPQLFNVLKGDMSLVGPRPEVPKYVQLYSEEEKRVFDVRPGITDPASIYYKDENEIISKTENPERDYIDRILPHKLALSMRYVDNPSLKEYFKLILRTIVTILE
jgi:lipopolysaccharide/colanic/teichoic acid biosynthesis glycosyltransferase